ncbi:unnamed protein product [Jaminaea pallidilutea]
MDWVLQLARLNSAERRLIGDLTAASQAAARPTTAYLMAQTFILEWITLGHEAVASELSRLAQESDHRRQSCARRELGLNLSTAGAGRITTVPRSGRIRAPKDTIAGAGTQFATCVAASESGVPRDSFATELPFKRLKLL